MNSTYSTYTAPFGHLVVTSMKRSNGTQQMLWATVILAFLVHYVWVWYRSKHIPGPFLASITNLQRVWWVKTGCPQLYHQALHARYGAVLRIGPNMMSFSNPEDIPTVYPIRPGFPKVCRNKKCHGQIQKLKNMTRPNVDLLERLLCSTTSVHPRAWLHIRCF